MKKALLRFLDTVSAWLDLKIQEDRKKRMGPVPASPPPGGCAAVGAYRAVPAHRTTPDRPDDGYMRMVREDIEDMFLDLEGRA